MNEFVNTSQIEPLSVSGSVLIFGVPALAYFIAFHFGMPRLIKRGVKPFFAYCVSMGIPSFGLMTASILVYLHEGNPFEWNSLLVRFNYHEMNGNDWLWTLGALVIMLFGYGIGSQISKRLINNGILKLPKTLPAWLDPRMMNFETLDHSMGGLPGNWRAFISFTFVFLFNVIGEELWWRGYIFPRQIIALGTTAWVFHGILWTFFHFFKWWDLIGLLFVALPFSFCVYWLDNNTPGLILHALLNASTLILILQGVLRKR